LELLNQMKKYSYLLLSIILFAAAVNNIFFKNKQEPAKSEAVESQQVDIPKTNVSEKIADKTDSTAVNKSNESIKNLVSEDANNIEKFEKAGQCMGASIAAQTMGIKLTDYSEIAAKNIVGISKMMMNEYPVVFDYEKDKIKCHQIGRALRDIKECVIDSIPNKAIAGFWFKYINGQEFIVNRDKGEAIMRADSLCFQYSNS